jgi:hypothetical protein
MLVTVHLGYSGNYTEIDCDPSGAIEVDGIKFDLDSLRILAAQANVGSIFEITSNEEGRVWLARHDCPVPPAPSEAEMVRPVMVGPSLIGVLPDPVIAPSDDPSVTLVDEVVVVQDGENA